MKAFIIVMLIILLNGCSDEADTAGKKGDGPRAVDAVAEKMAQSVVRPIEKAEAVKVLSEARGKELEEQAGD